MPTVRDHVTQLIADGWAVVPIVAGQKRPNDTDWLTKTYTPEDFAEGDNIGAKCGAASGWRVDVDLDAAEAVQAGAQLLYQTGLVHGRPGKPASHFWFVSPGTVTSSYKDVEGSMLVELRSNGGQTVIPPSTHSSGEPIEWVRNGKAATITSDELLKSVRIVAITALLARHWGAGGSRHQAAGHVAGFLLRLGIDAPTVIRMVRVIATLAKDTEVGDRERMARDTAEKFARGEKVTGGPKLAECFARGTDLAARVYQWMGREGDDLLDQLNEKHFVADLGGDSVVVTEEDDAPPVYQDFEAFRRRYYNAYVGKKRLGEWWLSHPQRRTAARIRFAPPPLTIGPNDYNTWRGFAVTPDPHPQPELRCARYLDHLYRVICNSHDEHFHYLLDLLALTVQRPGVPVEVAVVLRGPQGAGKGTFVTNFGRLFGAHYIQVDKQDHVTGRFNQHLSGKVVLFADEAVWAGNKQDLGALKRLVTERSLTIERKYLDAVAEPNCIHLFMATNEDWVWPAGLRERRGFILDVDKKPWAESPEYFGGIHDEWENGGHAAFLAFCQQRVVPGNRLGKLPQTSGLEAQQRLSLEPIHLWWLERLTSGEIEVGEPGWPEFVASSTLYASYQREVQAIGATHRRLTENALFDRMETLLPKTARRTRRLVLVNAAQHGPEKLVKAQRRGWLLPPLHTCRAAFDDLTGLKYHWPKLDGDQPTLEEVAHGF